VIAVSLDVTKQKGLISKTYSAGVSQEVRANGLHVALGGTGESTDDLEILLTSPTLRQGREGNVDNLGRSHCGVVLVMIPSCVWRVFGPAMIFLHTFFSAPNSRLIGQSEIGCSGKSRLRIAPRLLPIDFIYLTFTPNNRANFLVTEIKLRKMATSTAPAALSAYRQLLRATRIVFHSMFAKLVSNKHVLRD
jgi:hypothetical protein